MQNNRFCYCIFLCVYVEAVCVHVFVWMYAQEHLCVYVRGWFRTTLITFCLICEAKSLLRFGEHLFVYVG